MSNEANKVLESISNYYGNNLPERFLHATKEELLNIKGIGKVKAELILAIKEHCRKIYEQGSSTRFVVRSPEDAADYMRDKLRFLTQEHFVCLFLNTKNQVLAEETVFVGTLNSSIVHPREVFHRAVKYSSASIICVHNHPSNNPDPSPEDIDVTKRLIECGKIMGIDIMDHVIIGGNRYVSLKEKGHMKQ